MAQAVKKTSSRAPGELEARLLASGLNADLIAQYLELGIAPISGGSGEGEGSSDEGNAGDSQAENSGDKSQVSSDGGEETISLAEARKLRKEAQRLRDQIKALEGEREAADSALSDLEKAQKERDKLRGDYESLYGKFRGERVNSAALEAATKAGAIDPAVISRLIDADDIEFDDDLRPVNMAELVAEAKKAHPRLFQAAQGEGNGGSRSENAPAPSTGFDFLQRGYQRRKT